MRVKLYSKAIADLTEFTENLFDHMSNEKLGRAAGQAFALLMGVENEENDLDDKSIDDDSDSEVEEWSTEPVVDQKEKPFISQWEEDLPYPDTDLVICGGIPVRHGSRVMSVIWRDRVQRKNICSIFCKRAISDNAI